MTSPRLSTDAIERALDELQRVYDVLAGSWCCTAEERAEWLKDNAEVVGSARAELAELRAQPEQGRPAGDGWKFGWHQEQRHDARVMEGDDHGT